VNLLRGIFVDNLGLKLVALLLAVLVYLNVYTDRPATMLITFPIQLTDLADSLSLIGPAPAAVQVELRGRAKQLIRLRVTEPPVKVSLAGVGPGRFERAFGLQDLPIPEGVELQVDRMVSPRVLELSVDRRAERAVPVAAKVEGVPANGVFWDGSLQMRPQTVTVRGPAAAIASLDSVRVRPVSIGGRRDTVFASVAPEALPDWCTTEPERVEVIVPLEPGVTRRIPVEVESPPAGSRYTVTPGRVTAVISAPRRLASLSAMSVSATWSPSASSQRRGGRVAVEARGEVPEGVRVRFEPDSVSVRPMDS
jgi:YbbR domain-containing protein